MESMAMRDHVVVASDHHLLVPLLVGGACHIPRDIPEETSAGNRVYVPLLTSESSSSQASPFVASKQKNMYLRPLIAYVKKLEDARQAALPWMVFAVQDENENSAYFAVSSISWLARAVCFIPRRLQEIVQGARHPHRVFVDIDIDYEKAPHLCEDIMSYASQMQGIAAMKGLLRVAIKAGFVDADIHDIRLVTAHANSLARPAKVSWHIIARIYDSHGDEIFVQDTYHMLGFFTWLKNPETVCKLLPGMHASTMALLLQFVDTIDLVNYGAKRRNFRCVGQTKVSEYRPLILYGCHFDTEEEMFLNTLVVPPLPVHTTLKFPAPLRHQKTALCMSVKSPRVEVLARPGRQVPPRALDGPPVPPPSEALEFRLSQAQIEQYRDDPTAIFGQFIGTVYGPDFLHNQGEVKALPNSQPSKGNVKLHGWRYCMYKGTEPHSSNHTWLECQFRPHYGLPWYTQHCFAYDQCKPVARFLLPEYVAVLMQAAGSVERVQQSVEPPVTYKRVAPPQDEENHDEPRHPKRKK